jgi:hypothetical protein
METEEARQSLELVQQAMAQTRRAIARSGSGYFFIVWGLVWLVGYLGSEFLSKTVAGYLWLALDVFGGVSTVAIAIRLGRRVRSSEARRTGARSGAMWLLLVAYGVLLFWAADPQPERATVFISLFVAFGYVVAGLWISTPLLLTGLGITGLTLLAYLLFPAYLGLAIAIVGGGGMIVVGLTMLRAWE